MNFYALIIGTEILNGRRQDRHFEFIKNELANYGHELFASFIIKDDKKLIETTLQMIKNDKNAVLFSFGGIGSTPDDLTREISAKVFTDNLLTPHQQFVEDIIEKFGDKAYPHRIHMANLPKNATLLFNPINNMSGYSLENRYFFVPGFPDMAHPMIQSVIKEYYYHRVEKYRKTFLASTSEETLTTLMQKLPDTIELSSLPIFIENKANVELSLIGVDFSEIEYYFSLFIEELEKNSIAYKLI